jgi:hypothetical protein
LSARFTLISFVRFAVAIVIYLIALLGRSGMDSRFTVVAVGGKKRRARHELAGLLYNGLSAEPIAVRVLIPVDNVFLFVRLTVAIIVDIVTHL